MIVNRGLKGYNELMELLCTLSPTPSLISDLMRDFGYMSEASIRNLLGKLGKLGYSTQEVKIRGGMAVFVPADVWPKARLAAESYWNRLHAN